MADSIRQRKPNPTNDVGGRGSGGSAKKKLKDEDASRMLLDILRTLTFILVASCGLSYLITGGESWFWGMKHPPKYLQPKWWKSQVSGPLYLTLEELAQYDGKDPSKPIYLAINGTIYDVSSNPKTYGPDGSYKFFSGVDASRAYVTGCFADDRTVDMRGAEEMYLPIDDPEIDKHWSPEELAKLKIEERKTAEKKAYDALKHWVDFFAKSAKSGKYPEVGKVKLPKGWVESQPMRPPCEVAHQGRIKRVIPQ